MKSFSQLSTPSRARLAREVPRHLADSWFWMLDGRAFDSGPFRRTALVTAIHTVGREAWIQLECNVNANCSLVLHVTPETTLRDALEAIESMLCSSSEA